MSTKKVLTVEAQTSQAEQNLENVNDELKQMDKNVDEVADSTKKLADSTKDAQSGFKGVAGGVKKVGTSLKALGIGLVIAAFATLKELFAGNQMVMDKFATAGTAIQIMFNDLVSFIMNDAMTAFNGVRDFFANLTFEKFATAIKENIMERIQSTIDMFGYLASAVKNVFAGDFDAAMEDAKNAGKEFVDTMTGVDGTVDKVVETVGKAVDAVSEYATETYNAAEANVQLSKSSAIARAEQEKILKQYDNENEKLRQQRDNIFATMEERKAASDQLAESLEKQISLMEKQAEQQVAAAQAAYDLNQTDENRIALIEAETNAYDVQATVQGFRSEQQMAHNGLLQEEIDLIKEKEEKKAAADAKEIEDAKKKAEEQKKLMQTIADADKAQKEAMILAAGSLGDALQALAGENKALAIAGLIISQGSAAAASIMKFNEANMGALAASRLLPPLVSEGYLATALATNKVVLATSLAGIAVATGMGIANISKSGVSGGGGGTAGSAGTAGGSTPSVDTAPSFNVVESNTQNNQAENLANNVNKPMKAYVVSSEVESQAALDRKVKNNAGI